MSVAPVDRFQAMLIANELVGGRAWTRGELDALARQFVRVGAALGVVDELAPVAFATGTAYQRHVVRAALDAEARGLFGPPSFEPHAALPAGRATALGTRPARMVPAVDVNDAPASALAALPGLGATTAERIVARRDAHGPYRRLRDVRAAGRVSASAWKLALPHLTLAPGGARATVRPAGVRGLLDAAAAGTVDVRAFDEAAADPLALLRLLAARIARRPRRPRLWAPAPARLRRGAAALDLGAELPLRELDACGLLRNQGYRPFVAGLLAAARRRVRLTMFFLAAGPGGGGRTLMDALEAAHARGVDVRVILDDDLPGDNHGARLVNADAFARLRAAGIAHRATHLEVTTHEKTLVVDGRHVVTGSHNWTGSSLFVDDDTSVYADAPALARELEERFDRTWAALAPRARDRRVALAALELPTPPQRAALAAAGAHDDRTLTAALPDAVAERALARRAGMPVARLRLVRDVAALMAALRVAERTAALLAVAGLTDAAAVRAASVETRRAALERSDRLPEPLTGRPVNPDIAERLG